MAGSKYSTRLRAVSMFCETLLHGIYVALLVLTVNILIKRKTRASRVMIIIAIVMYGFAAGHLAITLFQLLEAITLAQRVEDPWLPANTAQTFIEGVNYVLGDFVVIWRVWAVWGRDWRACVAPSVLLFGSLVVVLGGAHQQSITPAGGFTVNPEVGEWATAFAVLTLATNTCCTILIGIRAWSLSRISGAVPLKTRAMSSRILLLLVETGALYSATWIVVLSLFGSGSLAYEVLTSCLPQLAAIYPTLLLFVVHRVYSDPCSGPVDSATLLPPSLKLPSGPEPRHSQFIDDNDLKTVVIDISAARSVGLESGSLTLEEYVMPSLLCDPSRALA